VQPAQQSQALLTLRQGTKIRTDSPTLAVGALGDHAQFVNVLVT
jgi:hypothetical protein